MRNGTRVLDSSQMDAYTVGEIMLAKAQTRRWGEAAITFIVLQDEMSQLNKRRRQFVSTEHFTVDSTLIRAWPSQTSRSGSAGNLHT